MCFKRETSGLGKLSRPLAAAIFILILSLSLSFIWDDESRHLAETWPSSLLEIRVSTVMKVCNGLKLAVA